jgi:hypothetical protein
MGSRAVVKEGPWYQWRYVRGLMFKGSTIRVTGRVG